MLFLVMALLGSGIDAEIGGSPTPPCFRQEVQNGVPVQVYIGDRACVDLKPAERMEGVWIDAFEGSTFIRGAKRLDRRPKSREFTWLTLDDQSIMPPNFMHRPRRHAWRLVMVAHEAMDMHRKPLEGYGHMNMSEGLVVVDRIIQARDLGPLGSVRTD